MSDYLVPRDVPHPSQTSDKFVPRVELFANTDVNDLQDDMNEFLLELPNEVVGATPFIHSITTVPVYDDSPMGNEVIYTGTIWYSFVG